MGKFAYLTAASLLMGALLTLVACNVNLGTASPSLQNIPSYSHAQNAQTTTRNVPDARRVVDITAFETNDSAADVLSFYESALVEQGWRVEDIAVPFVTGQDALYFRSGDSTEQCILIYGVDVVVNSRPNGGSIVEVQSWDICGTA